MSEFQTCKIYKYRDPPNISHLKEKLDLWNGKIHTMTGVIELPIKIDNHDRDELIFTIHTQKRLKLSETETRMISEEHKVVLSKEYKIMIIFRPQPTEFLPKLFATIIQGNWRPRIFYEIYYKKDQIQNFITELTNDDTETQLIDPRFYFNRDLYNKMSYFKFSAGESICATTIPEYENASSLCTTLEPIFRFKNISELCEQPSEKYRALIISSDMKFRSTLPLPVENWLKFIKKYVVTNLLDNE